MAFSYDRSFRAKVLMFPWLAYGHVAPFVELSKKLSKKNFQIYFCSTPVILNSVRNQVGEEFSLSIKLVEFHLPSLPDLPPHIHTTNGLPPHLFNTLLDAFDNESPQFSTILSNIKPDLLVYDFTQSWAPAKALALDIPAVHFMIVGAAPNCFAFHAQKNPNTKFPFPELAPLSLEDLRHNNVFEASPAENDRLFDSFNQSSDIILVKTFREIEAKYIDYLSVLTHKKIVPVGPLVHVPNIVNDEHSAEITKWLDKKEKSSCVLVSFGSEYYMSKEEMREIAHGLELCNLNFIWVVRFPIEDDTKIEEALPEGFLETVRDRGMVVVGWAPQIKILEHESIGGFVSHCGWSSVFEALLLGVPIIGMPMHIDQPVVAKVVVDVGVGLEIKRDKEGKFSGEEIAEAIQKVVEEKVGDNIKKKVREMREKIKHKKDEEIDALAEELLKQCGNNN